MNGCIGYSATERPDSDIRDASNGDFQTTGDALVYRLDGQTCVRRIYKPTDATLDWDLGPGWYGRMPIGHELLAIGIRLGCFGYIYLKLTGHKETKSPIGWMGTRCQVTWNVSENQADQEVSAAWIVRGYWKKGE